jgi:hypothetical protein
MVTLLHALYMDDYWDEEKSCIIIIIIQNSLSCKH